MSFTIYYLAGVMISGPPVIYFVGYLFREAFLTQSSGLPEHLLMTALAGLSSIGFSAFGAGTNGFANRIANPPEPIHWLCQAPYV